jgi:hypothetical protein
MKKPLGCKIILMSNTVGAIGRLRSLAFLLHDRDIFCNRTQGDAVHRLLPVIKKSALCGERKISSDE